MARRRSFLALEAPPILTRLHQAQERDGRLTRKSLENIADSGQISLSELYGFAKFFHYFKVEEEAFGSVEVCGGPVCTLPGLARNGYKEGTTIACPGLCDQPFVERREGEFFSKKDTQSGYALPHLVASEEVLVKYARLTDSQRLTTYRSLKGYSQLQDLLSSERAEDALSEIEASGLCGRGGAAFPVAAKLRAVRGQRSAAKYVVCNADEGEPGTFKDRVILHLEPHLLLEGMVILGYLVGASLGIIYLRYEYPNALKELKRSIEEARDCGFLGSNVGGAQFDFDIQVVRGAGSYVCGEETALLNSLEGRIPWPRERPPFPTEKGLFGNPTAVSNVETIACIPPLLEGGADWFRSLGRGENAGTKLYSVSGKVRRPGNYELPLGVTARELILDHAGGPPGGIPLKAFTLGGISGGLLGGELLDLPLDYQAPQANGFFLGSGGIVVLDETCCVLDFVRTCLLFYESESCGKCYPCRIGTVRLREFLDGLTGQTGWSSEVRWQAEEIQEVMAATSACGLGRSVPLLFDGLNRFFSEEVEEHSSKRVCRANVCKL